MLKITGVYAPPSSAGYLTIDPTLGWSAPAEYPITKDVIPHTLAGDFNNTGWAPPSSEWKQEGSSKDKIPLSPGRYVP